MKVTRDEVRAAITSARQTNNELREGKISLEMAKTLHKGDSIVVQAFGADARHQDVRLTAKKNGLTAADIGEPLFEDEAPKPLKAVG